MPACFGPRARCAPLRQVGTLGSSSCAGSKRWANKFCRVLLAVEHSCHGQWPGGQLELLLTAHTTIALCLMRYIEQNQISSSMRYIANKHSEDGHFHTIEVQTSCKQYPCSLFRSCNLHLSYCTIFPCITRLAFSVHIVQMFTGFFFFFFEPSIVGTNFHTIAKPTVVQESQPLEACPSIYPYSLASSRSQAF